MPQEQQVPMSYLPFAFAGVMLAAAVWLSVRLPPPTLARPCVKWHATRVTLAAFLATLAALGVLLGLAQVM
jgi:hypothetical protein